MRIRQEFYAVCFGVIFCDWSLVTKPCHFVTSHKCQSGYSYTYTQCHNFDMHTFCDRSQPGGHGGHSDWSQWSQSSWDISVIFGHGTGSLWPVTVVTAVTETFFSTQTFCDRSRWSQSSWDTSVIRCGHFRSRYGKFVTGHGHHRKLFQHTDILWPVTVVTAVTETLFSTQTFCERSLWSQSPWDTSVIRCGHFQSWYGKFVTGHSGHRNLFQHTDILWLVTVVTVVTAVTETFFSTQTFCDQSRWSQSSRDTSVIRCGHLRSRYGKFVTGHGGHGGHGGHRNLFQHTDILWPVTVVTAVTETFFSTQRFFDRSQWSQSSPDTSVIRCGHFRSQYGKFVTRHGGHGGQGGHINLFQHTYILWLVTVVTAVTETFFTTQTFCDQSLRSWEHFIDTMSSSVTKNFFSAQKILWPVTKK